MRGAFLVLAAVGALLVPGSAGSRIAAGELTLGRVAFSSTFTANGLPDIVVVNPDGSGRTALTNDPADDFGPVWSPNGRLIAFYSNRADPNDIVYDVYVMTANGSNVRRVTPWATDEREPTWSPDGKRLAFVSNRTGNYEIWTVSVEGAGFGKGFKRLTKTSVDESTPSWWAPAKPVAGSGRMAYSRSGNIWMMKDSGSGQKELTSGTGVDWAPEWSSDGKLIAYESDENADPYSKNIYETWTDLWTVDLKGTTTQLMKTSDVAEGHPTWVPGGGKRLLFDLAKDWGPGHPKHVWIGIFNGSVFTVTKQLTFGAGYLPGDFNPDWQTLP